jgi:hypothetical protein
MISFLGFSLLLNENGPLSRCPCVIIFWLVFFIFKIAFFPKIIFLILLLLEIDPVADADIGSAVLASL